MGFVNMHIPERYGGLGFGSVDACIAGLPALKLEFTINFSAENLAYGCSGISTAIGGPALAESPVLVGGSHEQKLKYLGRCAPLARTCRRLC